MTATKILKKRKEKGKNYTEEEERDLVRFVYEHQNIIECKATGKVNNE